MRLGGVDDVVAAVLPVTDQRLDQRGRMLAVAVHEQHGAAPRVIEAGGERRLLAKIARQRDDLHVKRIGRQAARNRERIVAAAVVDVDDFDQKPALLREHARGVAQLLVQACEAAGLIVERNDNRQAGFHARLIAERSFDVAPPRQPC
jgi:hypothetical protein